jgi:hypothetical protein
MTIDDFERATRLTGTDPLTTTMIACRMVVEDGMNPYAAARACGVSASSVYRKLEALQAAIARPLCKECGHPLY